MFPKAMKGGWAGVDPVNRFSPEHRNPFGSLLNGHRTPYNQIEPLSEPLSGSNTLIIGQRRQSAKNAVAVTEHARPPTGLKLGPNPR